MIRSVRPWLSLVFLCTCLVMDHPSAHARLIVSDSFNYSLGSLRGSGGASDGWSGSWSTDTTNKVISPGLTYVDGKGNVLTSGGNAVQPVYGTAAFREIDLSGKLGTDGTSIWLSFLAQGPDTQPSDEQKFHWGGVNLFDETDERVFFGKAAGQDFVWSAFRGGGGHNLSSTPTSEQVYFVANMTFGTDNESMNVWLNPDLDQTPLLGDADLSFTAADFQFDRIRIAGGDFFTFDELRIGTTFAAVSPVPEPSTFLLFALLLGCFGLARKGRFLLRSTRQSSIHL